MTFKLICFKCVIILAYFRVSEGMKLPNSSYHPQSNFSIWRTRTGFRRDNMSQLTYESGKRSDSTPAFSNTWDSRPGQQLSPPHPLVEVHREESCVKIGEGFISPEKCVISVGKYFPLERNWWYVLEAFIESASCATEKGKWRERQLLPLNVLSFSPFSLFAL